jgi:tetratricopeptide (TPR) repeat protein
LVDEMLKSRLEAEALVHHPNEDVRGVALEVLCDEWLARDDAFIRTCVDMAVTETVPFVQAIAVNCFSKCYENTNDVKAGQILASLVSDHSLSEDVRTSAYFGLLTITGILGSRPDLALDFRFLEDVDWLLVNRFLVGSSTAIALPTEQQGTALSCYQKGLDALQRGEYTEAIAMFSESLKKQPDAVGGYRMRGRTYAKMGMLNEAVADFTRAIELAPQSASIYHDRSQVYFAKGLTELGDKDRQKAIALEAAERESETR